MTSPADQLVGPLLRSVSRSFYLSIRILPSDLRAPIGLAYLLARATDTVADTAQIDAAVRKPNLQVLARAIQDAGNGSAIEDLRSSFGPLQTNRDEQTLIESLPQCLAALAQTPPDDQRDIRELLEKITRAQLLDVERFGTPGQVCALASESDLNEYTYLIAGCVGEFWTRMCNRHVRDFADLPVNEMEDLGRRYGAGLQLINILRDAGGDLHAGRCYLPNNELAAAGLTPADILQQPGRFMPVFRKWLERAEQGLNAGMNYALALRNRRIRVATALPALIGARTVNLLKEAGHAVLEEKIKVPRSDVQRLLRRVAVGLGSKKTLQRLFAQRL